MVLYKTIFLPQMINGRVVMRTSETEAANTEVEFAGEDLDERRGYERSIVQGFRLVFRSIQEHSRWVERNCGVSAAQLWSLWEIHNHPGIKVTGLSSALAIHRSTASNMLDKLEKKGLIRRERRGPDNRVVRLFLTEAGQGLMAQAPAPAQGALSYALSHLPTGVLKALNSNLGEVTARMQVKEGHALEPLHNGSGE